MYFFFPSIWKEGSENQLVLLLKKNFGSSAKPFTSQNKEMNTNCLAVKRFCIYLIAYSRSNFLCSS